MAVLQPLTEDRMRQLVPSAFAAEPWERMSQKYRMIPTIDVIAHLANHGFVPVQAQQSRTRIPGKQDYTRHMIRFNAPSDLINWHDHKVGDVVPQIALLNSHDGTSAYKIYLAMMRIACMNGLMVSSGNIQEVSVMHKGPETLAGDVLDASYRVIEQAPTAALQIEDWSQRTLTRDHRMAYAEAALELSDHSLKPTAEQLIAPRRYGDNAETVWQTFNNVQENLIRGGQRTRNAQGQRRHVRAINSVNEDVRLNRALWRLTEALTAQLSN
jgi:hypothetical protein